MTRTNPLLRWLFVNIALAALAFLCAGRIELPMLSAYLAMYAAITLVASIVVDPELLQQRTLPGDSGLDPIGGKGIGVLFFATVAVAALDIGRFHWTQGMEGTTQAIALTVVAASLALITWAMAVNPFFSSAVRLQSERGHRVISRGPYRFVRHPGYAAMFFSVPGSAIAVGSHVALIPGVVCSIIILRRTFREDRFLREELPGYPAYMMRVRYRLFPGLW